ncbi:hypothetical protein M595_2844 [Lyngbya aestuarii BL J]|uniref:Uncharacterized protein n=1 Tax=Lyngbya aestuarii BL J TaxID=1348334 RepID=U7Q8C1_9CYAN|nr:hypothetical protein M595_5979 [Lyngbya aestuarii BL J]ERT07217.1 hypothetical protein M595_2844 [Lyngbya aestuarii BL J]
MNVINLFIQSKLNWLEVEKLTLSISVENFFDFIPPGDC